MKYMIATVSLMALIACSHGGFVKHHMDKLSFDDAKDMEMYVISKKSDVLAAHKTCISDAKDMDALKKCVDKNEKNMKKMKMDVKDEFMKKKKAADK